MLKRRTTTTKRKIYHEEFVNVFVDVDDVDVTNDDTDGDNNDD